MPDLTSPNSSGDANLFIVIPCRNAAAMLPQLLETLNHYTTISRDHILCINDGSTDDTAVVLDASHVRVVTHKVNQGKGAALRDAYTLALSLGATAVLALDADLQHHPKEIPKFLKASETWSIVIGSRKKSFAPPMPWSRIFSNRTTSAFLSWMLGVPIEDSQCGYRLISAECLSQVLPLCHETGFMFETEFLIHAARHGFTIGFTDIGAIYDGKPSYISHVKDTLRFIRVVSRLLFRKAN
jgi:glycosyltransferase involved in cell wall biosynthesis